MAPYFKPLRRKIGVMTLIMACVFAVGWVRSVAVYDSVGFYCGRHSNYGLISADQLLGVEYNYEKIAQIHPSILSMKKV